MATGAPGTNGVWQYGEDDSEATFSALLNKAASTTDTQIGADRARLTTLEARKLSGLVPIVPSSVSVTGGSGSYNSTTGLVTFSGSSAVRIEGVFSSSYTNYVIEVNSSGSSSNMGLLMRMRASGSDYTTNNQAIGVIYYGYPGTISLTGGTAQTDLQIGWVEGGSSSKNYARVNVANPYLAVHTSMTSQATSYVSNVASGYIPSTNQFTGVTFTSGSAVTFTGTIKIYGVN